MEISEKLESIRVENRENINTSTTMVICSISKNNDTYEQIPIAPHQVERQDFLIEGQICKVLFNADDEQVLYAEPPDHLVLTEMGLIQKTRVRPRRIKTCNFRF